MLCINKSIHSAEGGDEEKANLKREKVIENQARINRKRAKKLEASSEGRNSSNIDELLVYKSEATQSKLKLGRKTRHQQVAKMARQTRTEMKLKRDTQRRKMSHERKWDSIGKAALAKWLSGGISKRGAAEKRIRTGTKLTAKSLMRIAWLYTEHTDLDHCRVPKCC